MKVYPANPIGVFDKKHTYGHIDPIEVCGKFVLRNMSSQEVAFVKKIAVERIPTAFRVMPLPTTEYWVLEIIDFPSTPDDILKQRTIESLLAYSSELDKVLNSVMTRALTLLRLSSPGCLGIILSWISISETSEVPSDSEKLGAKIWSHYRHYKLPKDRCELGSLVGQLWEKEIEKDPVVRWFNKSFAEAYLEDKLTDLVFALEQIYLRGESVSSSLSYKFALRCAYLLAADGEERRQIYKYAREGYKKRSKIVHEGAPLEPDAKTMQLILELEEYLRRSLLKYLARQPPFDLEKGEITDFWDDLILSATK